LLWIQLIRKWLIGNMMIIDLCMSYMCVLCASHKHDVWNMVIFAVIDVLYDWGPLRPEENAKNQ